MTDETNAPVITELTAKQQRFVHLYITGQYKLTQISELLGVHYNTISSWLRNDNIKQMIATYQEEEHELIETSLKSLRTKAIQKLGELVDSPIDGVALSAVKDILDRGGHKPTQKVEKNVTITTYEQQLKEIMNGVVIDVDFEDGESNE